jgi:hypothetical protein
MRIRWLKTVDGVPCAFPSAEAIAAGKEADVADAEGSRAIAAGLAESADGSAEDDAPPRRQRQGR